MTFSRAKPLGFTDDLDVITAAQADQIDTNQSQAIDGAGGGTYLPTAPIEINGAGLSSNNLQTSTIGANATLTRAATGHMPRLIDTTTVADVAAEQILFPIADKYIIDPTHTNGLTLSLSGTTGGGTDVPPGTVIELVRIGIGGGGGAQVDILDLPVVDGGAVITTFLSAYSNQLAGSPWWAKFWFDQSVFPFRWRLFAMSTDASP
jgi:hypothetical protein